MEAMFKLIYKTIIIVSARFLKFKIIHKFLPTRNRIKIWGIAESDECRFCLIEFESSEYLFWYCHVVSAFRREKMPCHGSNFPTRFFSGVFGDVSERDSYINSYLNLMI